MHRWLSLASQLTSQERARKCSSDFLSEVTSLHFIPFGKTCHCGTVLFTWRSDLAPVSLVLPQGTMGSVRRTPTVGWVLLVAVSAQILSLVLLDWVTLYAFLSYLCRKLLLYKASPCYRCHLIKINLVWFPLTVLRSLSFLIPPCTKNKHVILSCGTPPSNICLRSTRDVP